MKKTEIKVDGAKKNNKKRRITLSLCVVIIVVISIIAFRVTEPMHLAPAPIYMDDIRDSTHNLV